MQVSLEALELWDVIEDASKDRAKDRRALAAILHGVPPEMKARLAVKKSAKEAWDSVKKMRGGDERVKAANVQRLMKEFELLSFRDGETVEDFAVRVDRLTARLGDHREVLDDSRVVRKVLRAVPRRLKQVVVSIEIHGDLDSMTLDELVGQLQVAEDADAEDEPATKGGSGDQLLLTKGQWEARSRQHGGGGRRGGSSHGGDRDDDDDGASSTSSGRRGVATEAGASIAAHADTWQGSAQRRTRRLCSPASTRRRRSCEVHLRHVVFRGRLLGINTSMCVSAHEQVPAEVLRHGLTVNVKFRGVQELCPPPPVPESIAGAYECMVCWPAKLVAARCVDRVSWLGVVCVARVLRGGGRHDPERGAEAAKIMVELVPRTKRTSRRGGELPGLQEAPVLLVVTRRFPFACE
jgi:hypothetical protein